MQTKPKCRICRQPATRRRGLVSICASIDCEAELGKPVGIKNKPPKKRAGHDKSMLTACRGQRCYLVVPHICCSYDGDPTVVPCHSNQSKHGKGGAIKARDEFTVPGCYQCHAWLDQSPAPREEKDAIWDSAYERWSIDRKIK